MELRDDWWIRGEIMKNLQWCIAYCGHNCLGLITSPTMEKVTYNDGNTKKTWKGIHLTKKKYEVGSGWTSRHPKVVAQLSEKAGRELLEALVEPVPEKPKPKTEIEKKMAELIKWRESASDLYGTDLLDHVLCSLVEREGEEFVPEHLKEAFRAFKALPWVKQHNLVYSTIDAGPLCYGEEDGMRELIPEDKI